MYSATKKGIVTKKQNKIFLRNFLMIVAHWRCNDNADTNVVIDDRGAHNGVYHGTGTTDDYTSAHTAANSRGVGTCLDFDGTQDYIEVADHDDFTPVLTPFSISTWVYMHNAVYFVWASKWQVGSNQEWNIFTGTAKKIHFRMYDFSENAYIGRTYNTSLASYENQWAHFVATYDGGTLSSGVKIYLNGNRVDDADSKSGNYQDFDSVENHSQPVWIGRYDTKYANGLIDNVIIYDHALSASEVLQLYRDGAVPFFRSRYSGNSAFRLPRRRFSPNSSF